MVTANTYGRQVVVPLVNKSGGSVAAGDVVVVDTSNNDAFTTSTAGAVTIGIGIAQETIASNATGRILLSGYAALVNTSASVTRGNFGKTHTVVKQAVDAGASRVAGTFCQFLTGGTTPDAIVFPSDLGGGSGLVDPMTSRGDIIVRNASNVTARLAKGSAAQVLTSDGTDVAWAATGVAVGARATKNATQTITTSTGTTVTFPGTDDFDTDAIHDPVTNNSRLTVPTGKGGVYHITGVLEWDVAGGATGLRQIAIVLNGVTTLAMVNQTGTTGDYTRQHIACDYALVPTDYVELTAYHTRGSNLNVTVVVPTIFSMVRVGT